MDGENIKVARVKIIIDRCDGTHHESQVVMPEEIAGTLIIQAQNWRNEWHNSYQNVEDYLKAEEEFIKKFSQYMTGGDVNNVQIFIEK